MRLGGAIAGAVAGAAGLPDRPRQWPNLERAVLPHQLLRDHVWAVQLRLQLAARQLVRGPAHAIADVLRLLHVQ